MDVSAFDSLLSKHKALTDDRRDPEPVEASLDPYTVSERVYDLFDEVGVARTSERRVDDDGQLYVFYEAEFPCRIEIQPWNEERWGTVVRGKATGLCWTLQEEATPDPVFDDLDPDCRSLGGYGAVLDRGGVLIRCPVSGPFEVSVLTTSGEVVQGSLRAFLVDPEELR